MRLADLVAQVPGAILERDGGGEIARITYDSRRCGPGDLFVAVEGLTVDGHAFAAQAAAAGAAIAVSKPVELPPGTSWMSLPDTRLGLAELAAVIHGRPAARLGMAGVTGTDGKTTTTHWTAHVLQASGRRAGAMSTVALLLGAEERDNRSGQSTMEAPQVQAGLAGMVEAQMEFAVVEATSHALSQGRVAACDFDVAAFTNVGRDHLDYHATWEEYLEAKARLIDICAEGRPKGIEKTAILNRDDASFPRLARRPIPRRWSYSVDGAGDLRALDLRLEDGGSRYRLATPVGEAPVELRLPARFNVYNSLCAAGICLALGVPLEAVAAGLGSFAGVRGRLESVDLGQPFRVFVDYAHSATSLAGALAALRPLTKGRLMVVFGSTARSDHDRPGMGRSAAAGADYFVITNDDPLREDPAEIARQVASGAHDRAEGRDYEVILDRRTAIRRAIELARPGDVVLLAGKGHERTMLTASGAEPWDERAEAEAAIREHER